jgi:hypothetical protein
MLTHGRADLHQMHTYGSNQDGSSSVPALIHSSSGAAATQETMGELHPGQNLRVAGWPLSSTPSKGGTQRPSMRRISLGPATSIEKVKRVCFWGPVRWHTPVSTGSTSLA